MTSGIYYIGSLIDGKIYVGSAVNFQKRFNSHTSLLNRKKHHNKHLQSAWTKYGKENFIFEIIESVSYDELIKKEQIWIDILKPDYNFCKKAYSNLGCKWNLKDSTKAKISIANTGEKNSNCKLNKYEVNQIRKLYNEGQDIYCLAKEYDISFQNVSLIINNKRWYDINYKKRVK